MSRDTLLSAWALAVLAVLLALTSNHLRGLPVRPFQPVRAQLLSLTLPEAQTWRERGAVFLDVRPATEFRLGHIPGALNVPLDQLAARPWAGLARDRAIVLYCGSRNCAAHSRAAQALEDDGYRRLLVLPEGWQGWSAAGLPVQ